jgi:tryptophan-rich sensory protein
MSAAASAAVGRGRFRPIVLAALAAVAVGMLGGLMTDIGPWYESLAKPPWQPPDWLFGPAWTAIFGLTAAAGVLSWWASDTQVSRQNLLIAFLFNAVLNVTWSLFFFRLRRPDWALFEVFFLWASIVVLIVVCARRRPLAAWLLVPYLLWVSFAALLNYEILRLNPWTAGA